MDFEGPWFLGLAGAVLLASSLQTVSGIGFAVVVTPILLLRQAPHEAVSTSMILNAALCLLLVAAHFRRISSAVLPVLAGCVLGTPIGVLTFNHLNTRFELMIVSLFLIATGIPLLMGMRLRLQTETTVSTVAGTITGFLNGSSGLSGPPLALYVENQGWSRDTARFCLWSAFLVSSAVALALMNTFGQLPHASVLLAIRLMPLIVAGVLAVHLLRVPISSLLVGRASKAAAWIAVTSGLTGLASALFAHR